MSAIDFHKSTTRELLAIKDRVRNLINHWGEDGRYQEIVIKSMIRRFLPESFRIGSGFVVRQTANWGDHQASKQIDLIIYDTSYPILFKENDFVILTADSVFGIIEVKANLMNQNFKNIIKKANENGRFIYEAKLDKSKSIFNGIFSYESTINDIDNVKQIIKSSFDEIHQNNMTKFCVNHISFNQNWFYKFWEQELYIKKPHYLYEIKELSFSFFISNLMDWITDRSVIENSDLWFPIDKSIDRKEIF